MSKPIVYIELGFLKAYLREIQRPLFEIKNPYEILFIKDLINKSTLFYSIPEKDIEMILLQTFSIDESYDEDVKKFIQTIYLSTSSFPYSCLNELFLFKNGDISELKTSSRPNFLLLDANDYSAKKVHDLTGIISLPKPDKESYSESILKVLVKQIDGNQKLQPMTLKKMFGETTPCHTVLIEDPYLYSNFLNDKMSLITELIRTIINKRFTIKPFHIIFILARPKAKRDKKGEIVNQDDISEFEMFVDYLNISLQKQLELLSNKKIEIHLVFKEPDTMHDRNIISNSFWITCGSGFSSYYKKNTEWTYKPVGTYFDQLVNRIDSTLQGQEETFSYEIKSRFYKLNN